MAELLEITATFLFERFRFANADGDVIIGDAHANSTINGPVTVKGPAGPNDLRQGLTYLFTGSWTTYKNKRTGVNEKQFAFTGFAEQQPSDRSGIIAYLRDAGQGVGFGVARATALWEAFADKAIEVFRTDTSRVVDVLRRRNLPIKPQIAEAIADKLRDKVALEQCNVDLIGLLNKRGFRKQLPKWLIDKYGASAGAIVRRDPYKLLQFPGCGWDNVDQMYQSLGLPMGALKRQALAAVYSIYSDNEGHTWMLRRHAEMAVKSKVTGADPRPDDAIRLAMRAGLLREIRTKGVNGPIADDGDVTWLALRDRASKEAELARMIADMMDEPFEWPAIESIANIDGEQPEVLAKALSGPLAILGGRPGTGKTFVAGNLICALEALHGEGSIGIGAPTNLAAGRLTEAMAEYGVTTRARTWHSLLGKPKVHGRKWNHDEKNPFPFKVIIGDEESMKDLDIAHAVFKARAKGTQILLIGDINQLLPVGPGAPLRDMIAAGLPYGELQQIRRNSGGIVEACKAIVEGKPWGGGDNLEIIEADEPEAQQAAILEKLKECKAAGFDPVWDTRIIVCRNESRRALNKVLQTELNHQPGAAGSPFRVDDKIICRENAMYPVVEADLSDEDVEASAGGKEVKVANGELGRVLEVEEKYFVAKLSYPTRVIRIPRGKISDKPASDKDTGTGCAWELAYCVTFHSSQGSQFPWAILVASSRDGRMGCRELTYTGISRAESMCKMIGRKSTWDRFCRNVALGKRKTLLREQILLERAKLELAKI